MMGPNVSDLIQEVVLAFEYRGSSEDIGITVHSHPTLSETVKEAALAVLGRADPLLVFGVSPRGGRGSARGPFLGLAFVCRPGGGRWPSRWLARRAWWEDAGGGGVSDRDRRRSEETLRGSAAQAVSGRSPHPRPWPALQTQNVDGPGSARSPARHTSLSVPSEEQRAEHGTDGEQPGAGRGERGDAERDLALEPGLRGHSGRRGRGGRDRRHEAG
jgi:hypothetical protein